MTFEGAQFQGKAPIMEKLASLPFQKVQHQVTTMDAQPIIGVDDNKVRDILEKKEIKKNYFFLIKLILFQGCCRNGYRSIEDR